VRAAPAATIATDDNETLNKPRAPLKFQPHNKYNFYLNTVNRLSPLLATGLWRAGRILIA
jgi:hypothetical protein